MQKRNDILDRNSFLRTFFLVAFKHKKGALVVFGVVTLAGLLTTFLMPRVYEASATILMSREADYGESRDWLKSEAEIIRSQAVARGALQTLSQPHSSNPQQIQVSQAQAQAFLRNLRITNLKHSRVIKVTYRGHDAERTAAIANSVVEAYKKYRAAIYKEAEPFAYLEAQITTTDDSLRKLQVELAEYKSTAQLLAPRAQGATLLKLWSEYESKLTAVRTDRIAKEASVARMKQQLHLGTTPNLQTGHRAGNRIAELQGALLTKILRRNKLQRRLRPNYDAIMSLNQDIAALLTQINIEIRRIIQQEETTVQVLRAEEKALRRSIGQITNEIKGLASKEVKFFRLKRSIDNNRKIYSLLLEERERARIHVSQLQHAAGVTIIDAAVVPAAPVMPSTALFVTASLALASILALSFVFLRDYFDDRLHTTDEIKNRLGLDVLGAVQSYENVGQYIR